MDKLYLYHGSEKIIKKPVKGYGNPHNDYGLCFYCALDLENGKEWACRNRDYGYVNSYFLDTRDLKILDLTDKTKYSVLNWIAILLHFRLISDRFKIRYKSYLDFIERYYINVDEYDLVIGFRADDSYFKFPIAFLTNQISLEKLEEVYTLGDLGIQVALRSEKSFDSLVYIDYAECDVEYRYKYENKIINAKEKFEEIVNECINGNGTFIRDLVRENDKFLQ